MPAMRHVGVDRRQRGGDAAAAAADVVVVHRGPTARGSCWRRSAARASRRGARGTTRPRSGRRRAAPRRAWWSRPKRVVELELGAVADLADATRDREPVVRAVAGRGVVVVAAAQVRVGADARASARAQRDLLRGRLRAHRDHDDRARDPVAGGRPPTRARACRPSSRRRPRATGRCRARRRAPTSTATWSRMVMTGKRDPYGRPSGASDAGPVVPWQPPSTFGHTTKNRSVSIGAPGPDRCRPTNPTSGARDRPARRRGCRR